MLERFTDRARQVVQLAKGIVKQRGEEEVTPTHLFLGILKEGRGVAFHAFKNLGADTEELHKNVESSLPAPSDAGIVRWMHCRLASIPIGKEATNLLKTAKSEASRLGHHYVGTEHLLLLLLCRADIAAFLDPWGINREMAATEILRLLGQEAPSIDRREEKSPSIRSTATIIAKTIGHECIGTDHVLAGMIIADPTTRRILQELRFDLDEPFRRLIGSSPLLSASFLPSYSPARWVEKLPHTPRFKLCFELAVAKARQANAESIDTVLWLKALACLEDGTGELLRQQGVTEGAIDVTWQRLCSNDRG